LVTAAKEQQDLLKTLAVENLVALKLSTRTKTKNVENVFEENPSRSKPLSMTAFRNI